LNTCTQSPLAPDLRKGGVGHIAAAVISKAWERIAHICTPE